jgi:hypothetical protein
LLATIIQLTVMMMAGVLAAAALLFTWMASLAGKAGDLESARADATFAAVAVMVGVAGLLAVRLLLP